MNSASLQDASSLKRFLWKHYLTIFIVVAVSGVIAAIFSLLGVINTSNSAPSEGSTSKTISFDQKTIDQINKLNSAPDYSFSIPDTKATDPFRDW